MEQILDRVLQPQILGVFIPLFAVILFGLASVIKSLRGTSISTEEFEQVKAEVEQLRARVEELGHVQHQQPTTSHRNA